MTAASHGQTIISSIHDMQSQRIIVNVSTHFYKDVHN